MRCKAVAPIHHGAGTSGNTQLLRTQAIVMPDGTAEDVPFISGNSLKHRLRDSAMTYALNVMDVPDGSLTKPEVDLLFSGGRLSKRGAVVDLDKVRRVEQLFPALSLCGYSAGNTMTESKVRVSHLHIVCAENAWRLPADLADSPLAQMRCGALRGEEFGTRHDIGTKSRAVRYLMPDPKADAADSAQMIYDFQVIHPGAVFWGSIDFLELTDLEVAALASALPSGNTMAIGAKTSVGFGAVQVSLSHGWLHDPECVYRYKDHLRDHRDEILATIEDAVS